MASRGFYLVSAALVGSIAMLLLWLGLSDDTTIESTHPAVAAGAPDTAALGVRAADHDPANAGFADDLPPSHGPRPEEESESVRRVPAVREPLPPSGPPPQPVVADAALNAQAAASVAAQPKVIAALRADFDARRDALRQTCWPSGTDYAATFTVESTFLEDGTMVSLGISDVPGMPGVGTCIIGQIGQKPPVLPEAPGVSVTVAVPIAFAGSGPPPAEDLDARAPRRERRE